jgi:hypothetical protein
VWDDIGATGPSKRFGATAEEDELMDLTILNHTRPVRECELGNGVPLVTAQIPAKMPMGAANETALARARD